MILLCATLGKRVWSMRIVTSVMSRIPPLALSQVAAAMQPYCDLWGAKGHVLSLLRKMQATRGIGKEVI